jgi:hypothetical protein
MNHSLFTCDRGTHIKIVAVALVACIVVIMAAIYASVRETGDLNASAVIKAGKPTSYTTRDVPAVR